MKSICKGASCRTQSKSAPVAVNWRSGKQTILWIYYAEYPDVDVQIVTFTTKGDKILDKSLPSIGGKDLFIEELESALLKGDIGGFCIFPRKTP